ncbi:hydroxymethylglutaryl-CoA reductase, degradative [Natrialbaceae archaeon A-CW3]
MDSRIPRFYDKSLGKRRQIVADRCSLSEDTYEALIATDERDLGAVERLSENVIGAISFPLSVATNFRIDGEDRLVPMAIEESSVVAAASYGAKLARETGGFTTSTSGPYMIGQIQVRNLSDPHGATSRVFERAGEIRAKANDQGVLVSHGGGCEDVTARVVDTPNGEMAVVHLVVNVQDAMGANAVNTMAEAVAPLIEDVTGGETILSVLSNLADCRIARARCTIPPDVLRSEKRALSGEAVRDRIVDAWALAVGDPYRAATHNKGIFNGMDALAVATMNDWRAIEAGGHAFAARDDYGPLSTYEIDTEGNLVCSIEVPVQVGVVGGATRNHPVANASMEILDASSAEQLSGIFAAVGLAENIASMRALAAEGIQAGHMKLHAKNVAIEAGAPEELIDEIAAQMVADDDVRAARARELISELNR